MKPRNFRAGLFGFVPATSAFLLIVCQFSAAATIQKDNNSNALNDPASWVGGVVPGPADIAAWDATVGGANSTVLGGNLSWQGITISNPGGAVNISGANTLTLGTAGIDMSAASQSLSINSNLALASGNQTWNVATGTDLAIIGGTISRVAGATLLVDKSINTGTVAASPALTNNVLPWAIVQSPGAAANNTAAGFNIATVTGGNVVPFTAATAVTTSYPANSATTNYDWSAAGAQSPIGSSRAANTIRYTGTGVTQQTNSAQTQTFNALVNSGTGTVTLGGGTHAMNIQSATGELMLASMSAGIVINGPIVNNGATPGAVTIRGAGGQTVTLTGANTNTGGTFVNSGKLIANSNSLNSGPIRVASGATLTFTGNNQTSTSTVTGGGAILNDTANTIILTGNHTGFTGTFTHSAGANNTQFNAAVSGSANAAYSITAGELIFAASGDYTVQFGELSRSGGNIRGGNAATGTTTLEIGNLNTDSTISGNLNNGATKILALNKVGTGTLTLGGTNNYSGMTTVSAGTLRIEGAISASSSINNNAELRFDQAGTYTFPNPVTGSGTLTKFGTGRVTLSSATNNFSGGTVVNDGELQLRGNFGAISIADNYFATIGHAVGGALTASSLSFAGEGAISATLTGGPVPIAVTGALSTTPANGQVELLINSPLLGNGIHDVVNFGSFSGAASDFTPVILSGLNSRQSASVILNGSNIAIQVQGDSPKWTGLDSGSWTVGSTGPNANWKLIDGNTPTDFIDQDNVLFDDSATGATTVLIDGGNVAPLITLFENNSKNYTLANTEFGITSGSLRKLGTAALTIASTNSFAGGLIFEGGTLNLNSASAIGSGTFSIEQGTAKVLDNTAGSPVANPGANPQSWLDEFTFTGTNNLDLGTGTVTLGGDGSERVINTAAGTLTVGEIKSVGLGLTKQGAGTLTLTSTGAGAAASVLAGTLDVAAGTLQINRSGTNVAGSGDLTATGITGNGTILNGADVDRWLFINTPDDHNFTGTLANGGPGGLGFNKQGPGSVILSGSLSHTGQTTVEGGMLAIPVANSGAGTNTVVNAGNLVIGHPQSLGAASTIRLAGDNVATLNIATDGGNNLYGFVFASGVNSTILSNRATEGEGLNHTLTTFGANGLGGGTLTVASGDNVTSGAGRITFNDFGLSAATAALTTLVNPTTANVTLGNVSKVAAATAQTLGLGGTSEDNAVTGLIADGTAVVSLVKSNSSTWTISGANNTYSGPTNIGTANGAGVLRATASGALGTGAIIFDGSGGAPGPTSRLELSNGITLNNPIQLHQRNNDSAIILNTGGTNILSGNININTGGNRANVLSDAGFLTLSGTISTTTTTARNLHLGGAGNGNVTGQIVNNIDNPAGILAVHKNGAGTWTLTGANTYTGATTVNAGTLSVTQTSLSDTAAVNIATDAVLNLDHAGTDVVDRLFIGGIEQAPGTWGSLASSATNKTARITGSGLLSVTNGVSGYGSWATALGLTPGVNDASNFDAENDGFDNGTEYMLGGHPLDGANNPKIYSLIADSSADVDSDPELIVTIAVPQGTPAFSAGAPTSLAAFEGYVVTVRGSTDLATFPVTVTPVDPIIAGLPAAPVQGGITYEYRSFSLNGSNGTPEKGFLQVSVTHP